MPCTSYIAVNGDRSGHHLRCVCWNGQTWSKNGSKEKSVPASQASALSGRGKRTGQVLMLSNFSVERFPSKTELSYAVLKMCPK